MNYFDFANKTSSQKVVLAHLEAVERVKTFTLDGVYKKTMPFFVVGVRDGSIILEKGVGPDEWEYDPLTSILSINSATDPVERKITVVYRLFLANIPFNLPFDLNLGADVEYLPLITTIGQLKFAIDYEQTGIALETNSSISLENSDGFWDEIFDTLIFENQRISFYSWSPSIPITEARKIYSGVIKDKSFDDSRVSFSIVDDVYQLRKPLNLGTFTEADGTLLRSDLGKSKKRIYGRANNVRLVGLDRVLDGYPLSQAVTGLSGANTITGGNFFQEVSVGDEIVVGENRYSIEDMNNTTLTLSSEIEQSFSGATAKIRPAVPYRRKNRLFHVCGHDLHLYSESVTLAVTLNRFRVNNVNGLSAGDILLFGNTALTRRIRRVSGNEIVLEQSLPILPAVGENVQRVNLLSATAFDRELVISRDVGLFGVGDVKIEINNLAEFNIADTIGVGFQMTFTNGSREITTTADVDLNSLFVVRDWIISNDSGHQVWYEIYKVEERSIFVRIPYAGTTQTLLCRRKNPRYIDDSTLITASIIGKGAVIAELDPTVPLEWLKTPAQAVRDILQEDAVLNNLALDSFIEAQEDCPYTLSLVIDKPLKVRDAVNLINGSCFGSLYQDQDLNFAYKILNSDKVDDLEELGDDDILSFRAITKNQIVSDLSLSYSPFVDIFSESDTTEFIELSNDFVKETSGISEEIAKTAYLFNESEAETIGERFLFFRSLTQNIIEVKSKLNLAIKSINDKLYVDLDRLFKRYGSKNRKKIGIINSIQKNESGTTVQFNDLSGVFTRVPAIAPNDTPDYDSASDEDIAKYGFIVDNDSETPDPLSEKELGNNLIG
jgi:hypothetical protein